MSEREIDEISGVETTGHSWDGIKELDNPMPRWWLWTFYVTIVWAICYTIAFPAWPLVTKATGGMLGWASRSDVKQEMQAAEAAKSEYIAKIAELPVEEILADDSLRQFATAAGAAAFKVNCVQCHGSGATGSAGYPNLNDDDWLWGGTPEAIYRTISHGIRYGDDEETRFSEMPAFGEMFSRDEIGSLAKYVVSLSQGGEVEGPGAQIFADNCAACHGDKGQGDQSVGAPNLSDPIWLYGKTEQEIISQIRAPKHGVMPAWQARLGDVTVKELTVFVHSLGGGE